MKNEIRGFVMSNNQTLIGKVTEVDDDGIVLQDPLSLVIGQDERGQMGGGFDVANPFMKDKSELVILHNNVVQLFIPSDKVTSTYRSAVSGLSLPEKPQLITENT